MTYNLPDLPYDYNALEPYMSAQTLTLHHDKHHQAYVTNANKLIVGTGLETETLENVCIKSYKNHSGLFNNVAQHINHIQFWEIMQPRSSKNIPSEISTLIDQSFGSLENFKQQFVQTGLGQFGSGWVWLIITNGKLELRKTSNAENPLINNETYIFGCDVWEHSYYVDYKNDRAKYLTVWINEIVNWEIAQEKIIKAK